MYVHTHKYIYTIKCFKELSTYSNSIHIMMYIKTFDHLLSSISCQAPHYMQQLHSY